MNRFTATLITRNEEQNLPRALASLGMADEVLVVDCGSADRTCEIARQQGARVVERAWTDYSDQKNFAAAQAAHDWIFSLDADEELSPALQEELRGWKEQAPSAVASAVAYAMPRRAQYLGRWIRHSGWYPDPKIRLYRRDRARFAGRLHESLEVYGEVGRFQGEIHHYTFATVQDHLARVDAYTTIAAEELRANGRRHWLLPLLAAPPCTFLRTYLFQQGFRDGYAGYQIAAVAAYYVFLKYAKLRRLLRSGSLGPRAEERKL